MTHRLLAQEATRRTQLQRHTTSERKARTRTLIQLGGLVTLSGISDRFDIHEGDDLQLDLAAQDKGAILLGALSDLLSELDASPHLIEKWRTQGISLLKMRHYQRAG